MDNVYQIQNRVFRDMSEGVMVIGKDGKIIMTNPRITEIIGKAKEEMINHHFAGLFFEDERNDSFAQTVLDAIYENDTVHSNMVKYYDKDIEKYLSVITSGLYDDYGNTTGVIVVIADVTELMTVKVHNSFIKKVLSQYLSDEVANEVLNSKDGLKVGGKREVITILMSDLRGFTSMSSHIKPDDLMLLINNYLGRMGEIIRSHSGTVIEYVGDGVLAIFGAPVASDSHALDAVLSAVEMQNAMVEINQWNEENGLPKLNMGIGINTGEAVVGNMGSEYIMKYNVLGNSVNICGRIESYTVGGQVYISSTTLESIPVKLDIKESLKIHPKGVEEELEIYSVTGVLKPYNCSFTQSTAVLETLDGSLDICISIVDGKHVMEEKLIGQIVARSETEFLVDTDYELNTYDNVLLNLDGKDIYCKVMGLRNDKYVFAITG